MVNANAATATAKECPLCGSYLPSLGHLISEFHAAAGAEKAAVAARIKAAYPAAAAKVGA
jgi:hypothetical protein